MVTLSRLRNSRLLKPPQSCLAVGRMCDYGILYSLSDHEQWSKTLNILHTSVASLQVVSRPPRKGLVQLCTTSCVHAKILAWPIRFVGHLMNWCYPRHQTLPWSVGEASSRWPAIVQGHVTWHWVWHAGYFHYSHTIDVWQVVTLRGARKSGVGVRDGEGVRHCSVHMWVTLPHPHLHKLLHHLQSYCGYGEAYRMQRRRDCAVRVTSNRQKEPEQQPGLHQSSPPRPGVLLTQ